MISSHDLLTTHPQSGFRESKRPLDTIPRPPRVLQRHPARRHATLTDLGHASGLPLGAFLGLDRFSLQGEYTQDIASEFRRPPLRRCGVVVGAVLRRNHHALSVGTEPEPCGS